MAILDSSAVSTTDLDTEVEDFALQDKALDYAGTEKETKWDFTKATQYITYYKNIPELASAVDSLALWVAGKGYKTDDFTNQILNSITGWGQDNFQAIMQNMVSVKLICGDSFAEIIWDEETGLFINLKPISPERVRLVLDKQGRLERYDIRKTDGTFKPFDPKKIFHLCNKRFGDEIHGISIIERCKWVIDARNEALADERMIKHRELALGVLYIDEDNVTKRDEIKKEYAQAIKNGEMLVLPKGVADLKDSNISPRERIMWIRYLEGFFYQAVNVPRVIATSEGYTEAGGKVGYLTFEPVYTAEQTLLEKDLFAQLGIKIKFNRPASLGGIMQQDEAKNTGQVGFQPNDVQVGIGRE